MDPNIGAIPHTRIRREGEWFIAEAVIGVSADGALGAVAGARAMTEEGARAKLLRVMAERDAAMAELAGLPVDVARAFVAEAQRQLAAQDRPQAVAGGEAAARSSGEGGASTGAAAGGGASSRLSGESAAAATASVAQDAIFTPPSADVAVRAGVPTVVVIPGTARTLRSLLVPSADEVRVAVLDAVVNTVMAAGVAYLVAQHAAATSAAQAGRDDPRRAVPALVVEREPTPAPPLPLLVSPGDAKPDDKDGGVCR